MSQADHDRDDESLSHWQELQKAMGEPSPNDEEAHDVAQHIIDSECWSHTNRLLAVLKLVRMRVVTLDQVIALAEAHLEEAMEDE